MKFMPAILLAFSLAGCATSSVQDFRAPNGAVMKSVKCSVDPQKCFASASASCAGSGGSYQVITSHSNSGGALADVLPGPVTWYNMTYACGPSDGRMPDFAFRGQQYTLPPVILPPPAAARPRRTTTDCQKFGNSVQCTTY